MMSRRLGRPGVGGGGALTFLLLIATGGAGQEAPRPALDAETAREMLARQARADGWWVASNAEHRARNDALPDYYAMRFELGPAGYSSTGCMWGGRDGETLGPYWSFFNAWDPLERALLLYQVNPDGFAAVGHGWATGGENGEEEAIGRDPTRFRHVNTMPHPDTLVTRSFGWSDGEWVPRRHDVWVWTPAEGREWPVC